MNWIKEKGTKKNIIVSLTASAIFFVFIQPIMYLIWEVLKKFSSSTFDGLINGMYRNAALGQRNWIDFILLAALLLIGINFALRITLKVKSKATDIIERRKLKGQTIEEAKDYLIAKERELETKIYKLEKILIVISKFKWLVNILLVMSALHVLFSSFTDLQLNTSFNQRVNALAPYVTDDEIKLLKSKWALMKTREDFLEINMHMDSIAKKSDIILPDNLLK